MKIAVVVFVCAALNCGGDVFGEVLKDLCDSQVYCKGPLLDTVQRAEIFSDSKSFVDMKMKKPEKDVLNDFQLLMGRTGGKPDKSQVKSFVEDNFERGNELYEWKPPDYTPEPKFLNKITDESVKNFSRNIVEIWPTLGRKIKKEVFDNIERYSFIPVPNGFIVAGGRFYEYYYWDSYWIMKGLLLCEMKDTFRGIMENFLSLVERFGYIPNGGRLYYLNRSQPPLLTSMVQMYIRETNDLVWLKKNMDTLEKSVQLWLDTQIVTFEKDGKEYNLAHYSVASTTPRPESYSEDVQTAAYYTNKADQEEVYRQIKSGAESGWDFTSRWIFDKNGGRQGNLSNIDTTRVLPVDLNAFLCKSFEDLAYFYMLLIEPVKSNYWANKKRLWKTSIKEVLWNQQDGIWYDYDLKLKKHRDYFYPSNFAPLWAQCFEKFEGDSYGKRAVDYLKANNIFKYRGGIPTSLYESGQQWDSSNAWPPLQDLVVTGLALSGNEEAKKAAEDLAKRWIEANMIGYARNQQMYEKYDAEKPGSVGGGGEYKVQKGFGWTNGVVLNFINKYYTNP